MEPIHRGNDDQTLRLFLRPFFNSRLQMGNVIQPNATQTMSSMRAGAVRQKFLKNVLKIFKHILMLANKH